MYGAKLPNADWLRQRHDILILIGWAHVSSELSKLGFPLERNAPVFWMHLFYQLRKKIGMRKLMWNCVIEGGLFNPNLFFSATREKIIMWTASVVRGVKIHCGQESERYTILRFTSRRLIFKTEATLSPGNRRRLVVITVLAVESGMVRMD